MGFSACAYATAALLTQKLSATKGLLEQSHRSVNRLNIVRSSFAFCRLVGEDAAVVRHERTHMGWGAAQRLRAQECSGRREEKCNGHTNHKK